MVIISRDSNNLIPMTKYYTHYNQTSVVVSGRVGRMALCFFDENLGTSKNAIGNLPYR